MLGWPGSDWTEAAPMPAPPVEARWETVPEEARHTFTHFHLRLRIELARVPIHVRPVRGAFLPREAFRPSELPTVMRKVLDLAHARLPNPV